VLEEIRSWFNNNLDLISRSLSNIMAGSGELGIHTEEDLRTISTAAEEFKDKALALIDRLLA
jgi:hypothetical protein